jgi:hypothetical protein
VLKKEWFRTVSLTNYIGSGQPKSQGSASETLLSLLKHFQFQYTWIATIYSLHVRNSSCSGTRSIIWVVLFLMQCSLVMVLMRVHGFLSLSTDSDPYGTQTAWNRDIIPGVYILVWKPCLNLTSSLKRYFFLSPLSQFYSPHATFCPVK